MLWLVLAPPEYDLDCAPDCRTEPYEPLLARGELLLARDAPPLARDAPALERAPPELARLPR